MATRNWVHDAAERYAKRKNDGEKRATDTLAFIAKTRPVFEHIKKEIGAAVDEFNSAIGEQRLVVSGADGNILVVQSRHASDKKLGIRLEFNETAGTVTTSPADRSFGIGHAEKQKPFMGTYQLVFRDNDFAWKVGPGEISSAILVERMLLPVVDGVASIDD
jgi:hypothetical protein